MTGNVWRVPSWDAGGLLGLADLLPLIEAGDQFDWRVVWVSFGGDVRGIWPAGHEDVEAHSRRAGGMQVTWSELLRLAAADVQVIDGEFVGYGAAGSPLWRLVVSDSTSWKIWADQGIDRAAVRERFPQAQLVGAVPPGRSEIEAWFVALLDGSVSRDEADRWAASVMRELEAVDVDGSGWWGLQILAGIDLRRGPDEPYLHDDEQISEWLNEFRRHG